MQSENQFQIGLMNDFKSHGLRSMGLLFLAEAEELATDEQGRILKGKKNHNLLRAGC